MIKYVGTFVRLFIYDVKTRLFTTSSYQLVPRHTFPYKSGGYGLWVDRVLTKDNVADLPSREDYALLSEFGSKWVRPQRAEAFFDPTRWEAVALEPGPAA